MQESRFVLPDAENITITVSAADRLLQLKNGNAALLYLYILRRRGMVSDGKAAAELAFSRQEYENAMSALARAGLVQWEKTPDAEPAEEMPSYTAADVQRELENGAAFRQLAGEAERCLGRVLSSDDLMKLFGIYDGLGLPPEVILVLINSCKDEIHRRYGGSRMPTLRYIEKAAYAWERSGIVNLDLAEEYLRRAETLRTKTEEIRQVMQITGQPLTQRMREYIESWLDMGFEPEAVEIAYERTVENTGKLAWRYMDSILKRWHEKKWHTAEAIEKNDTRRPAPRQGQAEEDAGPTSQELERMKRILKEI